MTILTSVLYYLRHCTSIGVKITVLLRMSGGTTVFQSEIASGGDLLQRKESRTTIATSPLNSIIIGRHKLSKSLFRCLQP